MGAESMLISQLVQNYFEIQYIYIYTENSDKVGGIIFPFSFPSEHDTTVPIRVQKQPGVYAETVSHIVCLA